MLEDLNITPKEAKNIILIEEKIDIIEYFTFLEIISYLKDYEIDKNLLKIAVEDLKNNMLAGDNHIKAVIAMLSQSEDIKDFRILENFLNQTKPKLKSWAALAYAESRSRISSVLTDEEFTVLVGGLGGKNGKIRLLGVLYQQDLKPFSPKHEKFIEKEIKYLFEKNEIETEEIEFGEYWLVFKALFPLTDVVPELLISNFIQNLKDFDIKFHSKYILTNIYELDYLTIKNFIKNKDFKFYRQLPEYDKTAFKFITEWIDEYAIDVGKKKTLSELNKNE